MLTKSFFQLIFLIYLSLDKILLFAKTSQSTIIGLVTSDSVIISSNRGYMLNGVDMDSNYEWLFDIGSHITIALEGDPSDCEYIKSEMESFQREHRLNFRKDITCSTIAYYFRKMLADSLRSQNPLQINALVAGWDTLTKKPELFWLDSIGSIQNVKYSTHGRYTPFILSILDQDTKKFSACVNQGDIHSTKTNDELALTLTTSDGLDTVKKCWLEVQKRSTTSLRTWVVKCINEKGIERQ